MTYTQHPMYSQSLGGFGSSLRSDIPHGRVGVPSHSNYHGQQYQDATPVVYPASQHQRQQHSWSNAPPPSNLQSHIDHTSAATHRHHLPHPRHAHTQMTNVTTLFHNNFNSSHHQSHAHQSQASHLAATGAPQARAAMSRGDDAAANEERALAAFRSSARRSCDAIARQQAQLLDAMSAFQVKVRDADDDLRGEIASFVSVARTILTTATSTIREATELVREATTAARRGSVVIPATAPPLASAAEQLAKRKRDDAESSTAAAGLPHKRVAPDHHARLGPPAPRTLSPDPDATQSDDGAGAASAFASVRRGDTRPSDAAAAARSVVSRQPMGVNPRL